MITELKQLKRLTEKLVTKDEQLSGRVKQWRYVFDAIKDVVVIINTEFKVIFVNRAFHINLVDSDIPFMGRYCFDLLCDSDEPPSDRDKRPCEETFTENDSMELYIPIFNSWFRYERAPVIDDEANVLGYIIILKNVDKIREVESKNENILHALMTERNKSRELLEITPAVLLELDKNGKISFSNPEASRVLGVEQDKLKGLNWFDNFLPEKDREKVKEVFYKVAKSELGSSDRVYNTIVNSDGVEIPVCWRNSVIKDSKGNVVSILAAGEVLESEEHNLKMCEAVTF